MYRKLVVVILSLALIGLVGIGRATLGTDAQDASPALTEHPLVGSWVAMTPFGASAETFAADGSFVAAYPAVEQGPQGAAFYSAGIGRWESSGPRSGRFTAVQAITDAKGTSLGTLTIDGHLDVSADGQSFVDHSPQTTLTYRDATGAVIATITPFHAGSTASPVTGIRMGVGAPGIPSRTSAAATPGT